MSKQRFSVIRFIPLILGATALASLNAHAAAPAAGGDPWPVETPAMVYFGDTDSSGANPGRADVAATAGFRDPSQQDGPVVLAQSSMVDSQLQALRPSTPAEQREPATMLAHSGGAAAGMH